MGIFDSPLYRIPNVSFWIGREDGDQPEFLRWHQLIKNIDLRNKADLSNAVVLLGFCCDEGVRRNMGRVGAIEGPAYLRKTLANLPVHFSSEDLQLIDVGDIVCELSDLEGAQEALSWAVSAIIDSGGFPIVLGGGHELTYGHFCGIKKSTTKTVGIINIDAHLDIRQPLDGNGSSGTGFYQIADDLAEENVEFHYLAIGVQQISNTKALFNFAKHKGVKIIPAEDIYEANVDQIIDDIQTFGKQVDIIYLTIDMDAFAAAYAPGVSALAFNGITPDHAFHKIYETIIERPNLISMDLAELNPTYDIDNRTARLGADLIFRAIQKR
ncbi:formimidoylglutamase [Sphingobacterium olei]|uniref:Formimidoylglutamase n=1 Tax=Sphingobacterium olei TaxID=2571155 RepID=A0A4U0NAB8_9SPHI|nr:formimidoylglutamase [Sphingobacterium olei]TJZ50829.1 formimidoylglutamase [Sphingobacterium olei]